MRHIWTKTLVIYEVFERWTKTLVIYEVFEEILGKGCPNSRKLHGFWARGLSLNPPWDSHFEHLDAKSLKMIKMSLLRPLFSVVFDAVGFDVFGGCGGWPPAGHETSSFTWFGPPLGQKHEKPRKLRGFLSNCVSLPDFVSKTMGVKPIHQARARPKMSPSRGFGSKTS